jgi:hypothetical protein
MATITTHAPEEAARLISKTLSTLSAVYPSDTADANRLAQAAQYLERLSVVVAVAGCESTRRRLDA